MGQLSRGPRRLRRAAIGLAIVAVSITGCSAGYNALSEPATAPPRELSEGPFVEAAGVLTRYQRWGTTGSPIVLVGGFLEPTWVWDRVAPLLAQKHRVYALDLAGFGYSERAGRFTLEAWSDQVRSFLRALSIDRPTLIGHSLGGGVVAEIARADPALEPAGTTWNVSQRKRPAERSLMSVPITCTSRSPFSRRAAIRRAAPGAPLAVSRILVIPANHAGRPDGRSSQPASGALTRSASPQRRTAPGRSASRGDPRPGSP